MSLRMPKSDLAATRVFEELTRGDARLTVRKVFGHPTAFVNGRMVFGAFGTDLFVRLDEPGEKAALASPGFRPFEPMAGRPMRGCVVLAPGVAQKPPAARRWVEAAIVAARALPPKKPKARRP